jgi:hypothetical protein
LGNGAVLVKKNQLSPSPPDKNNTEKSIEKSAPVAANPKKPGEIGGPSGPEPTRYGDWEKAGRCSDF